MKNLTAREIMDMPKDELDAHHAELAKKVAINMIALVWIKITVPRVAAVCAKHALIRAAKAL